MYYLVVSISVISTTFFLSWSTVCSSENSSLCDWNRLLVRECIPHWDFWFGEVKVLLLLVFMSVSVKTPNPCAALLNRSCPRGQVVKCTRGGATCTCRCGKYGWWLWAVGRQSRDCYGFFIVFLSVCLVWKRDNEVKDPLRMLYLRVLCKRIPHHMDAYTSDEQQVGHY